MKKTFYMTVAMLLVLVLVAGCSKTSGAGGGFVEHHPGHSGGAGASSSSSSVPDSSSMPASRSELFDEGAIRFAVAGAPGYGAEGMVKLWNDANVGDTLNDYASELCTDAADVWQKLVDGEVAVAALPAEMAAQLNVRSEGTVQAAAIVAADNYYVLAEDSAVQSLASLQGKTILVVKDDASDYAFTLLLKQSGLTPGGNVTLEVMDTTTALLAALEGREDAVAVLPQPLVAKAQQQYPQLETVLPLSQAWKQTSARGAMVGSVLVVNTAWLAREENKARFDEMLGEYKQSVAWLNENLDNAAALCLSYGLGDDADGVQAALGQSGLTFLTGNEMKTSLQAYLELLFDADPAATGSYLPDSDFYYM